MFVLILLLAMCSVHSLEVVPVPGGLSGSGTTTRYWDCCKPSCSWDGNLNKTYATKPAASCAADGVTVIGAEQMSGCQDDGTAFMCTNQEPIVVNDTVSLGFVAASFTAGADVSRCCSCMLLTFKDQISSKKMVVQVTNTGSDLGKNHFDIAMPGGGVGLFNGCTSQWKAPTDGWGERYGGVTSIEGCDNLPQQLQAGCRWRFEWFGGAANPSVDFQEIECPKELIDITGCQ